MSKALTLVRDCDALLIPSGQPIYLAKGTQVTITQALGGSYTIEVQGNLARIAEEDADALGELETEATDAEPAPVLEGDTEHQVWAQMRTVYDPEIPVNVVDLGLIYHVDLMPVEGHESLVDAKIQMTLTAPGCGMGPVIVEDVKRKVLLVPDVETVEVELVFDPPWNQGMMSMEAKLQLNLL